MGIRYYAYPIHAEDVGSARRDPYPFLSDDPLADAWGPKDQRPRMLYLDKAWRELQFMFAVKDDHLQPRISLELVKGNVTPIGPYHAHIGFVHVLTPDLVREIAEDIVLVEPVDDDTIKKVCSYSSADYANTYLRAAQEFMTTLSRDGLGLVYTIR
ncbi:DUF1877 family protein [Gordonia sp. VNK1]|jgi:hypothetical protein|uniref:DUF1877 family protein n=1 Tax=Gordonia oleivorans TaxID=3156618 RepID=UPI0032B31BC1